MSIVDWILLVGAVAVFGFVLWLAWGKNAYAEYKLDRARPVMAAAREGIGLLTVVV